MCTVSLGIACGLLGVGAEIVRGVIWWLLSLR